jgi:crossover junction endodeoxyribonuclease RuvC
MAAVARKPGQDRPLRGAAMPPARLLGVDPGTRTTGFGIVELHGTEVKLVACGALRPPARLPLPQRLAAIFAGLEELLALHRPVAGAIEETFAGANPRSSIAMGEGRGVALLALARAGVVLCELSPAEVKKAVTGNGAATKELVARMVCARLGLPQPPQPADVTDALAVALALAHRWPAASEL